MTALATPLSAAALPQTSRHDAAEVMASQTAAYLALLRDLAETDWSRPTDCTLWDVRQMAAHVAGAFDESAHLRVQIRHTLAARRKAPPMAMVDALNEEQLADRRELTGPAVAADIERLAVRAIRKRRTAPGLIRRIPVPGDDLPAGSTIGYLFDVIYPRDVWMHRVDTARATGRPLLPADSDGEVVAQVVRDLARFWRHPAFVLELDCPGAGRWLIGAGTPVATVAGDAVEFMRLLSADRRHPNSS